MTQEPEAIQEFFGHHRKVAHPAALGKRLDLPPDICLPILTHNTLYEPQESGVWKLESTSCGSHATAPNPGRSAECGEAIRTADPAWSRETSAQPVANDRPERVWRLGREALLLADLTHAAVANRDGSRREQVASDPELVAAVMIVVIVVRFEREGQEIVHGYRHTDMVRIIVS